MEWWLTALCAVLLVAGATGQETDPATDTLASYKAGKPGCMVLTGCALLFGAWAMSYFAEAWKSPPAPLMTTEWQPAVGPGLPRDVYGILCGLAMLATIAGGVVLMIGIIKIGDVSREFEVPSEEDGD